MTVISGSNVVIVWSKPYDYGSTILGYNIYIRTSDSVTFAMDTVNCNGS